MEALRGGARTKFLAVRPESLPIPGTCLASVLSIASALAFFLFGTNRINQPVQLSNHKNSFFKRLKLAPCVVRQDSYQHVSR
jgi:hypothetical protein